MINVAYTGLEVTIQTAAVNQRPLVQGLGPNEELIQLMVMIAQWVMSITEAIKATAVSPELDDTALTGHWFPLLCFSIKGDKSS